MLGLIPHPSLPLLFGVCMEPDPILVTQLDKTSNHTR